MLSKLYKRELVTVRFTDQCYLSYNLKHESEISLVFKFGMIHSRKCKKSILLSDEIQESKLEN